MPYVLDTTFGDNGTGIVTTNISSGVTSDYERCMAQDASGFIYAAGYTDFSGGTIGVASTYVTIAKYSSDGALDTTFGGTDVSGIVITDFSGSTAYGLTVVGSGASANIFLNVNYDGAGGAGPKEIIMAKYDYLGNLVPAFVGDTISGTPAGIARYHQTNLSANTISQGNTITHDVTDIYQIGYIDASGNGSHNFMVRKAVLTTGGVTADFSYNSLVEGVAQIDFSGGSDDLAYGVLHDSGANTKGLYVCGSTQMTGDLSSNFSIVKLGDISGNPESDWGMWGEGVQSNGIGNGKIVVTKDNDDEVLWEDTNNSAYGMIIDDSNRLIVAGRGNNGFAMVAFNAESEGAMIPNWGGGDYGGGNFGTNQGKGYVSVQSGVASGLIDSAYGITCDIATGHIYLSGFFDSGSSNTKLGIMRFTKEGLLDTTFGINGRFSSLLGADRATGDSIVFNPATKKILVGGVSSKFFPNRGRFNLLQLALTNSPSANICFVANTPILTDQGFININCIKSKKNTINGQKIIAVTETITPEKFLVCFEKDSIEPGLPSKKTTMTMGHKIFYAGAFVEAIYFTQKFKNVNLIDYEPQHLYNILLATHSVINVNNLVAETLHPENAIAQKYNAHCFKRPSMKAIIH